MILDILFTANSGVVFTIGDKTFMVDALHNTKSLEFSALSDEMADAIFDEYKEVGCICCTHMHPDHYSEELFDKARIKYPNAVIFIPSSEEIVYGDGFSLESIALPHQMVPQSVHAEDVGNYGLVFNVEGKKIFVSGDASVADDKTRQKVAALNPDFAFVNFPWVALKEGRKTLEFLNPKKAAFIHLPYEDEDTFGFFASTKKYADKYFPDALIFNRFFQKEEVEI